MYLADLLSNLGGQDLNDEERKRALKWGLLNTGAGILANNYGNYGAATPAIGRGLQQGLLGYQAQLGREEAGAKQRKQSTLMQDAFKNAISQQTIPGQEMQGYGVGGNFTQDEGTANFMSQQAKDINDLLAQVPRKQPVAETFPLMPDAPLINSQLLPGMGQGEPLEDYKQEELMRQMNPQAAFEYNKQFGIATPNADGSRTMPPAFATAMQNVPMINPDEIQQEAIIPQTRKGPDTLGPEQFDMLKAARQLMQSGDPELMQAGFKIYTSLDSGADGRTSEIKNWQFAQGLPEEQRQAFMARGGGNIPSAIQVFEYMKGLPQEERQAMLESMRAPQWRDFGAYQAPVLPGNQLGPKVPNLPKPGEMPAFKAEQTRATDTAKAQVERETNAPKIQAKIASQAAKYKNLESTIDKAIKNSGFWSTGIMSQITSGVGGTPAKNLAATLDTIKANMGFDELQEMRDNSPTGGALGQVAVQEIQYLQSVIASLDQAQSNEQLKENLARIKQAKRESNERIRKAYEETYGKGAQSNKPPIDSLW